MFPRTYPLILLFILTGLLFTPEATGLPCCIVTIDDFTQGAINPANGPFDYTHSGLPPESCFGGSRRIQINDVPTHVAGMVPLGGSDIAFRIQTEDEAPGDNPYDDADAVLTYEFSGPTDLTAGGFNDRMIFDVISATEMSIFVRFSVYGSGVSPVVSLSPGQNILLFSDFDFLINMTQITSLELFFNEQSADGVAEATIQRIRIAGGMDRYAYMEIPELIEIGPPFPLPGPLMEIFYSSDEGLPVQIANLALTLENAHQLPVGPEMTPFPVDLQSSDSGGEWGPGLAAGFQGHEGVPGKSEQATVTDGAFDFNVALKSAGGNVPFGVEIFTDLAHQYGDVWYIPFEIDVRDRIGYPQGKLSQRIQIEIPDGSPYEFDDLYLTPPLVEMPLEFGFGFSLLGNSTGTDNAKAEGQPLFDIRFESDWTPYLDPSSVPIGPAFHSMTLEAQPNVLSDRTRLTLNRALDREGRIRIFDLAGRALRTLVLPAGQVAVNWDARDDHGQRLPTGVYLARMLDEPGCKSGRMVLIR